MGIATFRSASDFSEWGIICVRITIPCRGFAACIVLTYNQCFHHLLWFIFREMRVQQYFLVTTYSYKNQENEHEITVS